LVIPLSPNWWVVRSGRDEDNVAARLVVSDKGDRCYFEIVDSPVSHGLDPDKGTVKGGRVECPRCHTVIDGEEVKREAQNGQMGHQLYCVCVKSRGVGKNKAKWDFRAPIKNEEEAFQRAQTRLIEKLPTWTQQGLVPNEAIPKG
jgi:hypothetical protein